MGGGIQRPPGDKVTVENEPTNISPGVLMCTSVLSKGGVFLPCYTVLRKAG